MATETDSEEPTGIIQKLFDAGIVDKSVLDRFAAKTQADSQADALVDAAEPIVDEAAKQTGLKHKDIVDRVFPYLMHQEDASGDPNAVSPKGAIGVSQVMPETAKEEAARLKMDKYDLTNPEDNKAIGSGYYDDQLEKFGGDPELALAAYNAGPGRVEKALKKTGGTSFEDIRHMLPEETRNYVDNINKNFLEKEGHSLADIKTNMAQQQAAEQEEPGMLNKIGSAISAEMDDSAQAEEPPAATDGQPPQPQLPEGSMPSEADVAPDPSQAPTVQTDPNENQALASAETAAQDGDATATMDSLASGQVPPNTEDQLNRAFILQQTGKTNEAAAIAKGAQAEAAAYGEKAKAIAQVGTDFAAKRAQAEAATQSDLDRFRQKVIDFGNAAPVDADRMFKGPLTLGKIFFGISIAAVAIGGKPGQASNIINTAIDNDIAQQKANIELKKQDISNEASLMSANHSQLSSLDQAETQTRAQMLSKANAMVEQAAATARSEQAKANLTTLSGQLKQQQLVLEEKFRQSRLRTHNEALLGDVAQTGLSKSEQRFQDLAAQSPVYQQKLVLRDGKPVGFVARGQERQNFDLASNGRDEVNRIISDFRDTYKKTGTPIFSAVNADTLSGYIANLRNAAIKAGGTGNRGFAKEIVTELNNTIPPNLISRTWAGSTSDSVARIFRDEVSNRIDKFQTWFNRKTIEQMDNSTRLKTPEFHAELLKLKTQYGMNPKAKEIQ